MPKYNELAANSDDAKTSKLNITEVMGRITKR